MYSCLSKIRVTYVLNVLNNHATGPQTRGTSSSLDLFTSVQHTVFLSQRHNDHRQYLWLDSERMALLYDHKRLLDSYKCFDFWSLSSSCSGWRLCSVSAPWRAPAQIGTHYTLKSAHSKSTKLRTSAFLLIKRQAVILYIVTQLYKTGAATIINIEENLNFHISVQSEWIFPMNDSQICHLLL